MNIEKLCEEYAVIMGMVSEIRSKCLLYKQSLKNYDEKDLKELRIKSRKMQLDLNKYEKRLKEIATEINKEDVKEMDGAF